MDLEQRCVRPGLWEIEGCTVERIGRTWRTTTADGNVHVTRTWRDAREWIEWTWSELRRAVC